MFDVSEIKIKERQAQYPDAIRLRLPRGFRDSVKAAARAECVPASEFIRRAVTQHMQSVMNDDEGGSHSEARA